MFLKFAAFATSQHQKCVSPKFQLINSKRVTPAHHDTHEEDDYWKKLAERAVMSLCELIAEPETELKQILVKVALKDM